MYIQAPVLLLVTLLATASCAPSKAAADRHLNEHSLGQPVEKRDGEGILRYRNDEFSKREDGEGTIANIVVKYTDDEITKREDSEGTLANTVVGHVGEKIAE